MYVRRVNEVESLTEDKREEWKDSCTGKKPA